MTEDKDRAIAEAIEALNSGKITSERAAAKQYGIPRSTLHSRRKSCKDAPHAQGPQQRRLSPEQETFLIDWIKTQNSEGNPPSHARVREMASQICISSGDTRGLGKEWVKNFIKRNPDVFKTTEDQEKAIAQAIEALKSGEIASERAAAKQFGIPRSTLHSRRRGCKDARHAHESQQRLSPKQERSLVDWIKAQDSEGHPLSHARLREMAFHICIGNGDKRELGKRWVKGFIERNPDVSSVFGRRSGKKEAEGTE